MKCDVIKVIITSVLLSTMLVSCGDTDNSNDNSTNNSANSTVVTDSTSDDNSEGSSEETTTTTTTIAKETTTNETTTTEPEPEPEPEEPSYSKVKETVVVDGVKLVKGSLSPDEFTKKGWTEQKDEYAYSSKYFKNSSSNYISFADGAIMDPDNFDDVVYGTIIVHIKDRENMFDVSLPCGLTIDSSYDEIIKALGTPVYDGDYTEDTDLGNYIKTNYDMVDHETINDELLYYDIYIKYGRKNLTYYFDFEDSENLPILINFILSEDNSKIETLSVKMAQLGMR
ncbi:hypothetical protein [Ruminococcus sp. NK3A76]|uniref:hypothetical protein n=1 Tax=Ruminococcus sp. NK3A76 TaxID=877411 RepID=UPI000491B102|nr:hypothetical protein [Ruminococcus sp. NK3A76]